MLWILYLTTCTNEPAPETLLHNPEVLAFVNKNLISSASKQSDKSQGLINSVLQWRSPKGEKDGRQLTVVNQWEGKRQNSCVRYSWSQSLHLMLSISLRKTKCSFYYCFKQQVIQKPHLFFFPPLSTQITDVWATPVSYDFLAKNNRKLSAA